METACILCLASKGQKGNACLSGISPERIETSVKEINDPEVSLYKSQTFAVLTDLKQRMTYEIKNQPVCPGDGSGAISILVYRYRYTEDFIGRQGSS